MSLLYLQLFYPGDDFLCTLDSSSGHMVPHAPNLTLLVTMLVLHCIGAISIQIGMKVMIPSIDRNESSVRTLKNAVFTILIGCSVALIANHLKTCDLDWDSMEETERAWFRINPRVHVAVHFARALLASSKVLSLGKEIRWYMQLAVSGTKRRFVDQSFDLDLGYVSDRLLAMALPCVAGAAYRNDIREVARFFASRHYGRFMVFNLCESFEEFNNGNYDVRLLYDQVCKIPFRDHNACSLQTLVSFCKQATSFLNMHPQNVVAVHCRGGKGRTGTFCSSLLVWTGFSSTAAHAMEYFASRRTDTLRNSIFSSDIVQGVASPSQIRYVHYIECIRRFGMDYVTPRLMLVQSVTMRGVPRLDLRGSLVALIVETADGIVWDHAKEAGLVACYDGSMHGATAQARKRGKWDDDDRSEDGQADIAYTDKPGEFTFQIGHLPVARDVCVRLFQFENVSSSSVIGAKCRITEGGRKLSYSVGGVPVVGKELAFVSFHTAFHCLNTGADVIRFQRHEIDGVYSKRLTQFGSDFLLDVSVLVPEGPHIPQSIQTVQSPSCYVPIINNDFSKLKTCSGRRLAWLNHQLPQFFMQAGAEICTFVKGAVVHDTAMGSEQPGKRRLSLIVEGNVAGELRSSPEPHYFNPGNIRNFLELGVGEMIETVSFLVPGMKPGRQAYQYPRRDEQSAPAAPHTPQRARERRRPAAHRRRRRGDCVIHLRSARAAALDAGEPARHHRRAAALGGAREGRPHEPPGTRGRQAHQDGRRAAQAL